MDFYDVLLRRKTGKPCKNMFDSVFAGSGGGGGGKPALVPWATGTDDKIVAMVNGYYDGKLTIDEIKSVWSIGDCRSVDLAAMEAVYVGESHRAQTVEMMIIDFEHDDLTTPINDKRKALVSINQKNVLSSGDVYEISDQQNTEKGYLDTSGYDRDWATIPRREWCNKVYYQSIPSKMREIVKMVKKGSPTSRVDDYVSLLSINEIAGPTIGDDGYQYSYFKAGTVEEILKKRTKLPAYTGYIGCSYWTRTKETWERFYRISSTGQYYTSEKKTLYGIAPAFCL